MSNNENIFELNNKKFIFDDLKKMELYKEIFGEDLGEKLIKDLEIPPIDLIYLGNERIESISKELKAKGEVLFKKLIEIVRSSTKNLEGMVIFHLKK
jgi:hypothetical protein